MTLSPRFYAFAAIGLMGSLLFATVTLIMVHRGKATCGVSPAQFQTLPSSLTLESVEGLTGPPWGGDRASLIYFGYTFCPDVCPFDVARNDRAVSLMDGLGITVTPVFVTVDPGRDTVTTLADHQAYFHARMQSFRGSDVALRTVADAFGAHYQRVGDEPGFYLMDHTTLTYLVSPDGILVEKFENDLSSEQVADRTACILREFANADHMWQNTDMDGQQ